MELSYGLENQVPTTEVWEHSQRRASSIPYLGFLLLYQPVAEMTTKAKTLGSGEPFISSAGSLQSIKKHYWVAWRQSQQENQVQMKAGRKGSFLPLSSLEKPQLGRARGWDQLCFSLIA